MSGNKASGEDKWLEENSVYQSFSALTAESSGH